MEQTMNKRGQFFIAALVVLAISMFLIFSYVQTTTSIESRSSHKSGSDEFLNLLNVIEERNEKNAENWYDVNWQYRKKYVSGPISGPTCIEDPNLRWVSFNSNGHDDQSDCTKELVATKIGAPSTPITIELDAPGDCTNVGLPCLDVDNTVFYIYYGHPTTNQGNSITSAGQPITPTVTEEQAYVNCTQIANEYNDLGHSLSCNVTKMSSQTATYSVSFYSNDFKFYGNVS